MQNIINDLKKKEYYIGYLDGANCPNLKSFIIQIGTAFRFPDYYGKNMNAFRECINDLDWIEEKNYALIISNSDQFLESEEWDLRTSIWELLDNIKTEWASVPNYEGEEQYRQKADFVIIKE